jgi:hypothetical protein
MSCEWWEKQATRRDAHVVCKEHATQFDMGLPVPQGCGVWYMLVSDIQFCMVLHCTHVASAVLSPFRMAILLKLGHQSRVMRLLVSFCRRWKCGVHMSPGLPHG